LTGENFTLPNGFTIGVESVEASGPVTLGVRPDDLVLTASDGDDDGARVNLVELLGPRAIVTIDAHGTELTSVVEAGRLSRLGEGARVAVSARPGAVHVFDPETGQRHVGNPNR
jgi:multiple sugar transport system ATP-binding protein